jgi:hypothetical protein
MAEEPGENYPPIGYDPLTYSIHKFPDEYGRHPESLRDSFSSPDSYREKSAKILHQPYYIISI